MQRKLANILKVGLPKYRKTHGVSTQQSNACLAIMRCRTGELGWLQAECLCGYASELPCSCRNRHCPVCQNEAAIDWKQRHQARLPDIPTYHGVFTVPAPLHYFFRTQAREMYGILFAAAHKTLLKFSAGDRRLQGARLGILAILHTWGSQMQFHPHLHLLICGGGFTAQGEWKSIDPQHGYLFKTEKLSCVFRGILLKKIQRCVKKEPGWFALPEEQLHSLLRRAALKPWRVYLQRSRKSALHALDYLGRYTHRVAISEPRIASFGEEEVAILCKRDLGRQQPGQIRLGIIEFVRRFLQHILPEGFRKIRAYGFLASGWQQALEHARRLRSGGPQPPLDARRCPGCHALLHYTLVSHPLFRLDGVPP